jgi:hypothetical protein
MTRAQLATYLAVTMLAGCTQTQDDASAGGQEPVGGFAAGGGHAGTSSLAGGPAEATGGLSGTAPVGPNGDESGSGGVGGQPSLCGSGGSVTDHLGGLHRLEPDALEPLACSRPGQVVSPFERMDECACNGLVCSESASCRRVIQPAQNAVGGPDIWFNGCFQLCSSDADCAAPTECVRDLYGLDVCAMVGCRDKADCSADPCGVCEPGYYGAHGGIDYEDPSKSQCLYPGPCGNNSCAGCTSWGDAWHTCG